MPRPKKVQTEEEIVVPAPYRITLTPPADWCLVRDGKVLKHLLAQSEMGRRREAVIFLKSTQRIR